MLTGSFSFVNSEGTDAPPGCALESTGVIDSAGRMEMRQATADDKIGGVYFNGLTYVPSSGYGTCFSPFPGMVFGVHSSDTLAALDTVGTKAGDWHFRKGQKGFVYVGGDATGHRLGNASPDPATARVADYWFAQLTSGTSPYSWKERVESSAGVWADGARSGTTNAYQAQPSTGTPSAPATNDIVMMRASKTVAGKYEFVLADKAAAGGSIIPVTYSVGWSTYSTTSSAAPVTLSGLNLAAGKWLVFACYGARIQTTVVGDYLFTYLWSTTVSPTKNQTAYPCQTLVAGVQNIGSGMCIGLFDSASPFTVELYAQHTISGTITIAQLVTGWVGAIPATF